MSDLLPPLYQTFLDANGNPLSGGSVYTYAAGTSTPKATYTDTAGLVANANPIVLDSAGRAAIYINAETYKFVVKDSGGSLIRTIDNVSLSSVSALASAFYRAVVNITFSDSPYTITSDMNGKAILVDTTGGAVSINLPSIAALTPPYNICIQRAIGGTNNVTINRNGTDTIGGAASSTKVLDTLGAGVQLGANPDKTPDNWMALDFGAVTDGAVTTAKLADLSVTTAKIAAGAVTSAKVTSSTFVPRNYIDGFQCSVSGQSITVGAGFCADSTNADTITLGSSITKSNAGTWVVGNSQNGLDAGTVANNTTYHIWAIKDVTNNIVDVLISTSASAPTMPTNYTLKRRILTIKTQSASSSWIVFTQNGDRLILSAGIDAYNVSQAAVDTDITLTGVPTGVTLKVFGSFGNAGTTNATWAGGYVTKAGTTTTAPSNDAVNGVSPTRSYASGSFASGDFSSSQHHTASYFECDTNTSAQVRLRTAGGSSRTFIFIVGWADYRGKDGLG